ncbi:MAG TPA: hypothetical protein ENJ29_06005 [Bacteroidetes bacterium]|nr:hypothetical protein [Bacteroidota bacterium]
MTKKIRHLLEYAGVRLLTAVVTAVPLTAARGLGRALGWLTFTAVRIRRDVTLENLRHAFPEKDEREIKAVALATYKQFGMMMVEYLRMPKIRPQDIFSLLHVADDSPLRQAHAAGKGAILLTAHFGNWEYLGIHVTASGYPTTYLFQEQSNPLVDALIRDYRVGIGMDVVPRGMAVRSTLRALQKGRFVAFVADQDAGRNGIFIDFLGRPASTPTGPARFAIKAGAPVVFCLCYRDEGGDLHGYYETLYDPATAGAASPDETVRTILTLYNRTLEKWIRDYPDHWFWMHKRWKTRPQ